jgi:uncharacterized protein YqiB (DUF1249 family)
MQVVRPRFVLNGCQPRTLASLLDLQECSYRRLQRLAPGLRDLDGTRVSRVQGALDLHLTVVDRQRYTSTIHLTYRFPGNEGPLLEPDLTARVYHDARLAETVAYSRRHRAHPAPCRRRGLPSELEARWEENRFLQRWLGYCLHQGHMFLHIDRDRTASVPPGRCSTVG